MTTKKSKSKRVRSRANNEGSIYFDAKRNRWIAQITLTIDCRTGKAPKRTLSAKGQQEALDKLSFLRDKYAVVTHIDADKITVREWMLKWYNTYKLPKIRENTAVSYSSMIDICNNHLGSIHLDKLQSVDLQNVIFNVIGNHYRTAQYFRTIVKAAMRRAVKNHLIKESPAEDLELPPKPRKKKFARPTREAWQLLLTAETSYYCWRMLLLTEYVTGLRLSELLALTWDAVSYEYGPNKTITGGHLAIRHALILGKREKNMTNRPLIIAPTKTEEGSRDLALPPEYLQELSAYKAQQAARRLAASEWKHPEMVFTREDGSYINPGTFSSSYYKLRTKLGIRTTFHMLRHDMASRMKRSHRFDLKDIQAQLGHSNIQITMDYYTHIDEEDKNEVSCWLGEDFAALQNDPPVKDEKKSS